MGRLRTLVVSGSALALSAALAQAADKPDYPSLPLPSREKLPQSVELSSGWYLRGDLGYQFRHVGSSLSGDTTLVPSPASAKLDDAFMGGGGAGYAAQW